MNRGQEQLFKLIIKTGLKEKKSVIGKHFLTAHGDTKQKFGLSNKLIKVELPL